jgi:hypothetical protein
LSGVQSAGGASCGPGTGRTAQHAVDNRRAVRSPMKLVQQRAAKASANLR